jgi:hypothetical protein
MDLTNTDIQTWVDEKKKEGGIYNNFKVFILYEWSWNTSRLRCSRLLLVNIFIDLKLKLREEKAKHLKFQSDMFV